MFWKDSDGLWASLQTLAYIYVLVPSVACGGQCMLFFQGSCQWYTNLSAHSLHLYFCFVTHTVCVCVLEWACLPNRPLLIWPAVSLWWGTPALLHSTFLYICMDMERRLNLSLSPFPRQAHMTRQPLHRCSTASTAKPGQRTRYSGPNKDVLAWGRGKKKVPVAGTCCQGPSVYSHV